MYSNLFVVCMGVGTVFVGLICIIFLCYIVGFVCKFLDKPSQAAVASVPAANVTVPTVSNSNHGEIVAAISAALGEELGTDVSAIKIISIKEI